MRWVDVDEDAARRIAAGYREAAQDAAAIAAELGLAVTTQRWRGRSRRAVVDRLLELSGRARRCAAELELAAGAVQHALALAVEEDERRAACASAAAATAPQLTHAVVPAARPPARAGVATAPAGVA